MRQNNSGRRSDRAHAKPERSMSSHKPIRKVDENRSDTTGRVSSKNPYPDGIS